MRTPKCMYAALCRLGRLEEKRSIQARKRKQHVQHQRLSQHVEGYIELMELVVWLHPELAQEEESPS